VNLINVQPIRIEVAERVVVYKAVEVLLGGE